MPQVESQRKANPLWYAGICDELYQKIAIWDHAYWRGIVHSTRKWLDPKLGQPIDKPTKMAHEVPFREVELEHLVRIVGDLRPKSQILEEVQQVQKMWKNGKPVQGLRFAKSYWVSIPLPKGIHRIVTMCFYPEHVKELLTILNEARTGVKPAEDTGKDLFEQ